MKRRHFLQHSAAGAIGLGLFSPSIASAAKLQQLSNFLEENDKILVLIFLAGGNDGLNTIVPMDYYSELNSLRSNVMIPESSLLSSSANDGKIAFHPAFAEMRELYEEGKLHIVQNVGYEEADYSHFRSTDIWMSASESNEVVDTGVMGRYLDDRFPGYPENYPNIDMPDPLSIEAGSTNSLLLNGPLSSMSYIINNIDEFNEVLNEEFNSNNPATPAGERHDFITLIKRQSNEFGQRITQVAQTQADNLQYFPDTDLAKQLAAVSRLIAGGCKTPIYKLEIGGFDTHNSQVLPDDKTQGLHTDLLRTLSQGVKAFMDDLDRNGVGDKVIGTTFSEFGRRIVSNDSFGTDHGSAAPMFIFGNSVEGGVTGSNPVLDRSMNYGTNLPYEVDFKRVYSSLFEEWFCADKATINKVLGADYEPIGLTDGAHCLGVGNREISFVKDQWIHLLENPVMDQLRLVSKQNTRLMRIKIVSTSGKVMTRRTLHSLDENYNTSVVGLAAGMYFINIEQGGHNQTVKMIKM